MSEKLVQANAYVDQKSKERDLEYVPLIHLSTPIGWINDPNGFCYYNGSYHLFAQFYPYDSVWGSMHWAHWTSADLVRWQWRGVAMAPDMSYDSFGCFSGSAIQEGDRLIAMYTSVRTEPDLGEFQEQSIAISTDGEHLEKFAFNPVITLKDLPKDASLKDFRDPKLFKAGGKYHAIVASRSAESGQLLIYTSDDLKKWDYEGKFLSGLGMMVECPDYFALGDRKAIICSVMSMPEDGLRFPNKNPVVYLLGKTNAQQTRFETEALEALDFGLDLYAPQTAATADGRRVMIGWMKSWNHTAPTHYLHHGWHGAMSLPRELSVRDGKLCQYPVRELLAYREPIEAEKTLTLAKGEPVGEPGRVAAQYDVRWAPGDGRTLRLRVMEEGDEYFEIAYDADEELLTVDRAQCGWPMTMDGSPEENPRAQARVALEDGALRLSVFVDVCSVEVFAHDGELAMTSMAFPKRHGTGWSLLSPDGDSQAVVTSWGFRVE